MKNIFSSSTRITLLMIITTVCVLALARIPVSEQFQAIATVVVSFFFGMKAGQTSKTSLPPLE